MNADTTTRRGRNALIGGLPLLMVAVAMMVGVTVIGANAGKSLDDTKPSNSPSYETHEDMAARVCGGPVVAPNPEQSATDVVVVRMDGRVVRMDTSDAWGRVNSKTDADDVWVIGVCVSDLR